MNILFDAIDHVYKKPGIDKTTSVTTFIHEYEKPYDIDYWSDWIAIKETIKEREYMTWRTISGKLMGEELTDAQKKVYAKRFIENSKYKPVLKLKKQETLDAWEKTNSESKVWGTKVHEIKENWRIEKNGGQNIDSTHKYDGKWKLSSPLTENEEGVWYPEQILDYKDLIGTCDEIMWERDCSNTTNRGKVIIHINDWKTNKKLNVESWNKKTFMKSPLDHLQQCEWSTYRLQISLYMYMAMQQFGGEVNCLVGSTMITHIDRTHKHLQMPFLPLMQDVRTMLKHSGR